MKHIKLKDLLKETQYDDVSNSVNPMDEIGAMIEDLTPEQREDNAEIFGVLGTYFAEVKKHGGSIDSYLVKCARESLEYFDIDGGLVEEFLNYEGGAGDSDSKIHTGTDDQF